MYKETQRIQIEDVGGDFDQVTQDEVQVWRALKGLTDGEARKVVLSVRDEDGFLAWRKLCLHFEPTLAAMQGRVIAEFGAMVTKPAKDTAETRRLVTELDQRKKLVEDLTGETVS